MANLSIDMMDDDTMARLRKRAANHKISTEEETKRLLRQAVTSPIRLSDLSLQLFGSKSGGELELPRHTLHEPLNLA